MARGLPSTRTVELRWQFRSADVDVLRGIYSDSYAIGACIEDSNRHSDVREDDLFFFLSTKD